MKDNINAYAIFNITQNKYIFKFYGGGRRYLIYGDLASARRMLNQLKEHYRFKDDKLRIVELVPKIEGYSYQEHEPTPDNPCEIKTILCNDIEIPVEFLKHNFVIVDGKKYIELQQENQQLKEELELKSGMNIAVQNLKLIDENQQLKDVVEEIKKVINNQMDYREFVDIVNAIEEILDKVGDNNV